MNRRITGATRLVALLGDPVAHSLSPLLQNAAFQAAGVDGVYVALRCEPTSVPEVLRALCVAGGAGNVTVPHKRLAAECLQRRTPEVERTGTCNTFWSEGGELCGDNTDVLGISRALEELVGAPPRGAEALVLGAGGAAAAAIASLAAAGAARVTVLNRSIERAAELSRRLTTPEVPVTVLASEAELGGRAFDLAVNATSLGMRPGDPLPLPPHQARFGAALDIVYRPEETAWVRRLREHGVRAADGLAVLLHQGAAAFERWWGCPAPLTAMRAALPSRYPHGAEEAAANPR